MWGNSNHSGGSHSYNRLPTEDDISEKFSSSSSSHSNSNSSTILKERVSFFVSFFLIDFFFSSLIDRSHNKMIVLEY